MITINTQEELEALIIDGEIVAIDHLIINCNIDLPGIDIEARNIKAKNINAKDIRAHNINTYNINACNINANIIKANIIKARDIKARNVQAIGIIASDIDAWDIITNYIKAGDIRYYSFVIARKALICKSIKGSRPNALHKCQDKEIEFI